MQFGAEEVALGNAMEKAQIEGECFVGETLILMKPWVNSVTGARSERLYIEQIEVGDEVLSRCEITGEMAYKKVTKVFAHGYAKVSVISCDYGPEFFAKFGPKASDPIHTTANHPFWVEGKGWTKVRDLQAGDEFLTHNGVKATFRIANLDAYEMEVYNLEVEDFHTYFVEAPGIWVHNKIPIDFKRMDTNAVADPKPQWTPLHDSEANLTDSKASLEQRKSELDQITTKTAAERQEVYNFCTEPALNQAAAIDDALLRQDAIDKLNQGNTCFAAGTLVHTKSGLKPIEEIEIGDWVLTFPDTQTPLDRKRLEEEYIFRQVTEIFAHEDEEISQVTVFDLAAGIKEILRVTPNHPFYVEGIGWTPVAKLAFGRTLTNSVFGNLLVTKVRHAIDHARVFNIEVADCHTYYVGELATWVHNKGTTPTSIASLKDL